MDHTISTECYMLGEYNCAPFFACGVVRLFFAQSCCRSPAAAEQSRAHSRDPLASSTHASLHQHRHILQARHTPPPPRPLCHFRTRRSPFAPHSSLSPLTQPHRCHHVARMQKGGLRTHRVLGSHRRHRSVAQACIAGCMRAIAWRDVFLSAQSAHLFAWISHSLCTAPVSAQQSACASAPASLNACGRSWSWTASQNGLYVLRCPATSQGVQGGNVLVGTYGQSGDPDWRLCGDYDAGSAGECQVGKNRSGSTEAVQRALSSRRIRP